MCYIQYTLTTGAQSAVQYCANFKTADWSKKQQHYYKWYHYVYWKEIRFGCYGQYLNESGKSSLSLKGTFYIDFHDFFLFLSKQHYSIYFQISCKF